MGEQGAWYQPQPFQSHTFSGLSRFGALPSYTPQSYRPAIFSAPSLPAWSPPTRAMSPAPTYVSHEYSGPGEGGFGGESAGAGFGLGVGNGGYGDDGTGPGTGASDGPGGGGGGK